MVGQLHCIAAQCTNLMLQTARSKSSDINNSNSNLFKGTQLFTGLRSSDHIHFQLYADTIECTTPGCGILHMAVVWDFSRSITVKISAQFLWTLERRQLSP